jgi:hypothetical protein
MTITEFLLARIADREADARSRWRDGLVARHRDGHLTAIYDEGLADSFRDDGQEVWNPLARELAECAAKRAIVTEWQKHSETEWEAGKNDGLECAMRYLATVYADHRDFDPAWT